MYYKFVNNLPHDAVCSLDYPFPYKFGKSKLFVYEPCLDFLGGAGFYRRSHSLDTPLAKYLKSVDFFSSKIDVYPIKDFD